MHFYRCYKKFSIEPKINARVQAEVSSADRSDLGPVGIAVC